MSAGEPFVIEKQGPAGIYGVFEDDAETGYLYLYEPAGRGILWHLHIYDRSPRLSVSESDVSVVWSEDGTKCGVKIRGAMRGIIDVAKGCEGRVWMEADDTPGIGDCEWLRGFDCG